MDDGRDPLEAPEHPAPAPRPAWAGDDDHEQDTAAPRPSWASSGRPPAPGQHEDDGLWTHALEIGGLVTGLSLIAAVVIPHTVALWMISTLAAAVTVAVAYTALSLTNSVPVAVYLATWGACLTGWITYARLTGPWHGDAIFALLLPALVLTPVGVTVIRRHRDRFRQITESGRDTVNIRECKYWQDLLVKFGVRGVAVRDVIKVEGGVQVHCRLGKHADGRRVLTLDSDAIRDLGPRLAVHKRLAKGAVYIEEEPAGGSAADFIIHVRSVAGPRLARWLPAENTLLSITRPFGLGVFDTGKEFRLRLRELRVFLCGIPGSGKSTTLNVLVAQLCRMPDALIFMIDLKGGQEAMAWLMPWITGQVDRPVIDWLATTREEADIMLDALNRAGKARAESGRHGKKLRPTHEHPAIIPICDESTAMTGHGVREDNLSNTKLAVKLLNIAEMFRSVAIDPVVSAVRAVVDNTGNSGYKAMSGVKIGMRVGTQAEGQSIFPDNLAAAKQLAQLRDPGTGIVQINGELTPVVHFYNITDGEPDDDGHPTEDRITPVVLATAGRRPSPEQLIRDAMNAVKVKVGDREMGAYDARWEQPHMAKLIQTWREAAGVPRDVPPALPGAALPDGSRDADIFQAMIQADPLLSSIEDGGPAAVSEYDDGENGRPLHPAHKRMRLLLIGRGREGYKVGVLWPMLLAEGLTCSRETVHRWLAADEKKGYVYRTGKVGSRWIWRLPEGAEFDIPGMDT
jgi:hypothetical protein